MSADSVPRANFIRLQSASGAGYRTVMIRLGVLMIAPVVALIAALSWIGIRRVIAGRWSTEMSAARLRRRWWFGVVLAFGCTTFMEVLVRFARPVPANEEGSDWIPLGVFLVLSSAAWFALLAFLIGDQVRFDNERVERRHPFRKIMRMSFADVDAMHLRSSVQLQTRRIVASAGNKVLVLDPDLPGFELLARRFLERVKPTVIAASRLRPFLLPLAQPGRFDWDARDRIGYAADGSQDEFDLQAAIISDDEDK